MWDSPRLLNAAANGLLAVAFAVLAYAGFRALVESPAFPLRTIRVEGELQHVARADVIHALQGKVRGTFFSVDLEAISTLFEGIPWVRRAEVRRQWPDCLEVRIEEHVALGRWGGQGKELRLVNSYGELFSGRSEAVLPLLSGPAGTEGEVARRYVSFRELLARIALEPRQVALNSRLAWQLKLSNGLTIQLGRDSERDGLADRLEKFVSTYPQTLGKMARRIEYVDLRYPNGFALRVPENRKPESAKATQRRA